MQVSSPLPRILIKKGSVDMQTSDRVLLWLFTGILIGFCAFMIWFVPARGDLDFQLADIEKSLDTSYGRERKQQYEYDEVTEELPRVRAELAEIQPQADAAAAEVSSLKETRSALRAEKAELEAAVQAEEPDPAAEGGDLP